MIEETLKLVVRNLARRKLRTFLTLLGIIIGVGSLTGVLILGESMKNNVYKQLQKFGGDYISIVPIRLERESIPLFSKKMHLTDEEMKIVSQVEGVDHVFALIRTTLPIKYKKEEFPITVNLIKNVKDWKYVTGERIGLEDGRFFDENEKNVAVIGYDVAHEIFSKDIEVGSRIYINGVPFKVVGIANKIGGYMSSLDQSIYISIEATDSLGIKDKKEYNLIGLNAKEGYDPDKVADAAEEALRKYRKEKEGEETFTVIGSKFFKETIDEALNTMTMFQYAIASISLLVGGIGIANIMYVIVLERTREIGIMKAVGATRRFILILFLIESGIIGLIGAIIGDLLGVGFSYSLSNLMGKMYEMQNFSITIKPVYLAIGALIGFMTGVIFGILPAKKASEIEIVQALRYE